MNKPFCVGFCVSGQGRLFRSAAIHASALGITPTLVVLEARSSPDLEGFCQARQIPVFRLAQQSRASFDQEITRLCNGTHLDLLCLTFDKLLPSELVVSHRGRIINVHPALLPAFKGMRSMEQALAANARFSGATVHEVDEEMDHGPLIAQCVLGTRRGETAESLGRRLFPLLRLMYLQVIAWYAAGRIEKDADGRVWVRDAVYGESPISPALEESFPD